ncbi:MAG: DUF3179 domain-containing (seleno)protein [Bacteroidia bacterium]|nr:DUF3179 domain-containing (seleno)protein [Bacteroidia bacterium]
MKKLFYLGLIGLMLFEAANVYFIMPMPGGSQEIDSIDIAYALHTWRWVWRAGFALMIVIGYASSSFAKKWIPPVLLIVLAGTVYAANFSMAADTMFYQPETLSMKDTVENLVDPDRLVLGVEYEGQAKAYPIQYLGYHHQIRDSIGGKPIMVTYCTVCRTGRIFEPVVQGRIDEFRLVGMDRFNAMFEDKSTGSWWRQATGEAVAGPSKGSRLPEFPSAQTTLATWIALYPNTLIMQPDHRFQAEYDSMRTYEAGRLTGRLTRRDTASWQAKSWIIGVDADGTSKAYDWNLLMKERMLYDVLQGKPIAVILSEDSASFVVLERITADQTFTLVHDTIKSGENAYDFMGRALNGNGHDLKRIRAHQEYWHSWQAFHPLAQPYQLPQ